MTRPQRRVQRAAIARWERTWRWQDTDAAIVAVGELKAAVEALLGEESAEMREKEIVVAGMPR